MDPARSGPDEPPAVAPPGRTTGRSPTAGGHDLAQPPGDVTHQGASSGFPVISWPAPGTVIRSARPPPCRTRRAPSTDDVGHQLVRHRRARTTTDGVFGRPSPARDHRRWRRTIPQGACARVQSARPQCRHGPAEVPPMTTRPGSRPRSSADVRAQSRAACASATAPARRPDGPESLPGRARTAHRCRADCRSRAPRTRAGPGQHPTPVPAGLSLVAWVKPPPCTQTTPIRQARDRPPAGTRPRALTGVPHRLTGRDVECLVDVPAGLVVAAGTGRQRREGHRGPSDSSSPVDRHHRHRPPRPGR